MDSIRSHASSADAGARPASPGPDDQASVTAVDVASSPIGPPETPRREDLTFSVTPRGMSIGESSRSASRPFHTEEQAAGVFSHGWLDELMIERQRERVFVLARRRRSRPRVAAHWRHHHHEHAQPEAPTQNSPVGSVAAASAAGSVASTVATAGSGRSVMLDNESDEHVFGGAGHIGRYIAGDFRDFVSLPALLTCF